MNQGRQKDGGFGWVVVFAFFTSSIIIDSLRYAFGLLYVEFLSEFNQGKGATAWVGSVLVCVYNILGPVLAAGINRFGVRVSAIAGSIIGTVGLVASSFADQIYVLFFTYGIVQGIGLGMMFLAGWVAVCRYFEKRRGLALGIGQCGSGIGAFAVSPLLKIFIDEYTWRGAMLILAGVCLNGCVLAMFYRPVVEVFDIPEEEINDPSDDKKTKLLSDSINKLNGENDKMLIPNGTGAKPFSKQVENNDRHSEHNIIIEYKGKIDINNAQGTTNQQPTTKKTFRKIWCFNDSEEIEPKTFADMREEQLNQHQTTVNGSAVTSVAWASCRSVNSISLAPIILGSNASLEQIIANRRLNAQYNVLTSDAGDVEHTQINETEFIEHKQFSWNVVEKLFPRRLVTDIRLILLMVSAVFYCMAVFIPISLIADYGRIVGCSESEVVWFVSAMGIGGTIGRVICGFIADIACINRLWFLAAMLLICSVSTLVLPLFTAFPCLLLYSLAYGLGLGSLYVIPAMILMDNFGEELIPQSVGVYMYVSGVSAILGVPIAGWLFDATDSYTASFLFCGGLYMCSVISNLFVLCVPNKQTSNMLDETRTM